MDFLLTAVHFIREPYLKKDSQFFDRFEKISFARLAMERMHLIARVIGYILWHLSTLTKNLRVWPGIDLRNILVNKGIGLRWPLPSQSTALSPLRASWTKTTSERPAGYRSPKLAILPPQPTWWSREVRSTNSHLSSSLHCLRSLEPSNSPSPKSIAWHFEGTIF